MRYFLALAVVVAVTGCEQAPPPGYGYGPDPIETMMVGRMMNPPPVYQMTPPPVYQAPPPPRAVTCSRVGYVVQCY